jgi:hypothetical protein
MLDLDFLKRLRVRTTTTIELDEDERDVHYISSEILLKYGEENPQPIGLLSGYRIHSNVYSLGVLEPVSQDLYEVAEGLEKFLKNCEELDEIPFGNYYIIDRISIEKKYRNLGVGKCFLAQFIYGITSMADVVFVNPQPFELKKLNEEAYKKEELRLAGYYKKLGFKKIKGSNIHYFQCERAMELGEISDLFPSSM